MNALLYLNNISVKKHSSIKSQFSNYFVKTGKFDVKYGRLLSELFDWRQRGDYENIYDYNEETVRPLFEPVKEMLYLIEQEINRESNSF